jgi:co-chaperonin GroES (HSP10)
MIENTSGIIPTGHAVLLLPYEPELKATRLVIPDTVKRRTAMAEMRAVVVAVGPQAWKQERKWFGLKRDPRAKVGDKVIISMYCGAILQGPADGKQYRAVNDEDIFAVIASEDASIVRDVPRIRTEAADELNVA